LAQALADRLWVHDVTSALTEQAIAELMLLGVAL
jgi:hypothetical protein